MTALVAQATQATIQGWLIIAILAIALICLGAGAGAAWDAALAARARRQAFDDQLAHDAATGYCQAVVVDGHPIRIHSDRPIEDLTDVDRDTVDFVVRLLRTRLLTTAEAGEL